MGADTDKQLKRLKLLNAKHIMQLTGLSRSKVYEIMREEMYHISSGRNILVTVEDYQEWLKKNKRPPQNLVQ